MQVTPHGTWGTAVLTVERSNGSNEWSALASATAITAAGFATIDVTGVRSVRLRVSAAEGSALKASVSAYLTAFGGIEKNDTPPAPIMLDLNSLASYGFIPCARAHTVSINAAASGTWSTAVVTLERSNNGRTWAALSPAATITGAGWTAVDTTGIAYLKASVTTAEGSSSNAVLSPSHAVAFPSSGGSAPSQWEGVIPIVAEEGGNLSTGTSSGYQFSMGNGDTADDFGAVVPTSTVAVAMGLSCRASTTATVEVYCGDANTTTNNATGIDVALSGQRSNFTVASTAYNGDAGDWITFRTTSGSGGGGARVTAWIRER